MKVHAFLGIDPVIIVGSTDLQWQTVEVAFSGGKVESAVAEYSSLAVVTARDKTYVGIGDLSGSGNTYPSGLAMTVTFSSDTDMDDVKINFHSPITAITPRVLFILPQPSLGRWRPLISFVSDSGSGAAQITTHILSLSNHDARRPPPGSAPSAYGQKWY